MRALIRVAVVTGVFTATLVCPPASAQMIVDRPGMSEIRGRITTLRGTTALPGALVACLDADGRTVAETLSDGGGTYRLTGVPAGSYRLRVTLAGFAPVAESVTLRPGIVLEHHVDLPLATVAETIDVVERGRLMQRAGSSSGGLAEGMTSTTLDQIPLRDGTILAALPLLPGVIDAGGGLSIRGGLPTESAFQLGMLSATEPSLGQTIIELPADAVGSFEVLPNPYAVEFGRFSSGVTVVRTREGGRAWHASIRDFDPTFTRQRGELSIAGIEAFSPRVFVSGPIVKDRLFLAESLNYRYSSHDVSSRPQSERRIEHAWSSFSRLDLTLGKGRTLSASIGAFPRRVEAMTLNTFNPPDVAVNWWQTAYLGGLRYAAPLSPSTVVESSAQASRYEIGTSGRRLEPMIIAPAENSGSYFLSRNRSSRVLQWTGAVSTTRTGRLGQHLLKTGFDLLHVEYDGTGGGQMVRILRQDGSLAQTIVFGPSAGQHVNSTDAAVFAQDHWQPAPRLLIDVGVRADRDGVPGRWNASPRVGTLVMLNRTGSITMSGGVGVFHDRTPSSAGAFAQNETRTITKYLTDGVTPLEPAVTYRPRDPAGLETARSLVWNLDYEHRVTPAFSVRAGYLERAGTRQLIVSPEAGATASPVRALLLDSTGRSSYREAHVSMRYARGEDREVEASYLRSSATADLNAFSVLYDPIQEPVVRPNQYGPMAFDTPHRILAHTLVGFARRVRVYAGVELRSGFPYSALDDQLDVVGARNGAGRFPFYVRTDLSAEVRLGVRGWRPWIGVRVYNAFDAFVPRDVQQNLGSPAFGQFYNSVTRTIRLSLRLEK